MRKVIVNIARSSLVAAFCCSACFAQTAETSRAGTATRINGADSRLPQSPRELLKRGWNLYLHGEFAKAVTVLEQVDPDADLTADELKLLTKSLESARKKAGEQPERRGVTARAQSPDARGDAADGLAALKKDARRLADAAPAERKAAAAKWTKSGRAAFNQGDVDTAQQIAELSLEINAQFKAAEDSPERLLADVQEARKQDAAWKKDQSSAAAKRNRSQYLLGRAQQAIQQGDAESAEQFVSAAEQIKVTPGVMDKKPSAVRQDLEALRSASPATVARSSRTAGRTSPRGAIQQVGYEQAAPVARSKDSPEAMRVKADKSLREAQLAERQGKMKEAWRLAKQAEQLEIEGGLKYGANEPRPSQYVAKLSAKMPEDPASLAIMEKEIARDQADAEDNVAFAENLLVKAKAAMQSGDLVTAREHVEHVLDLKVDLDALSVRPEVLLDEMDRNAIKTASSTKVRGKTSPRSSAGGTGARTGEKAKAQKLMAEAKAAMEAGDLDQARAKTLQASQIKVAYDAYESDPAHLMAQIDQAAMGRRGDGKMLAKSDANEESLFEETSPRNRSAATAARTGSRTAARTGRRTSPLPAPKKKEQALELAAMARTELEAGHLAEAKKLAKEAIELNAVYQLFEDAPEMVLADIEREEASAAGTPDTGKRAPKTESEKKMLAVGPEAREPDLAQRQATLLLKQARLDLKANKLDQAKEKALQAENLDASYAEWEDTPSKVLQEVERANSVIVADASSQAGPAENPFEDSADSVVSPAGGVDASVINPEGTESALELYRVGKEALRRGQRAEAYHLFLQAYHSGEKLPPRLEQQLEDLVAHLAPKKKNEIRRMQNLDLQVDENTPVGESPVGDEPMDAAPGSLEHADQTLAVKVDKLRTEVMNSIFRADRAREKNPEEALKILDKVQRDLENSDLAKESVTPLMRSVARARELAQASKHEQQSNIDQKNHNKAVKENMDRDTKTRVRVEQEFADLTEKFNDMMKQKRYSEAELIAKKAGELDSGNPSAELMKWKAIFAKQNSFNADLKDRKDRGFTEALNSVDESSIPFDDRNPIVYNAKVWEDITKRRKGKYGADNHIKTEEEKRIEKSLLRQVSMQFENEPLQSVINRLAVDSNINIRLDPQGLEEQSINSDTPITITVTGIQMKSALNLILEPLNLGYTIKDEVLKITSVVRQKGDLETRVYPVADLVLPLPNFANSGVPGLTAASSPMPGNGVGGPQFNVAATRQHASGQAFAQVPDGAFNPPINAAMQAGSMNQDRPVPEAMRQAATPDFDSLVELMVATVEPNSWDEVGGPASVRPFETTLSLVIRQTQAAHDEIQDLLAQLRRLQDLQVSIEVRFVTVSDKFFERIGIDFDFNLQGTAPVSNFNKEFGDFLPPFGTGQTYTTTGTTSGTTTSGTTTSGTTTSGTTTGSTTTGSTTSGTTSGVTSTVGGTASEPFAPGPPRDLTRRGDYPKLGTIVGLERQLQFSNDLQIPFRQGSFDVGIPDFGSFKPDAGMSMGFAILSDIETFFFIQAAQGDARSNILFAPKVTLFNGQLATVQDTLNRPFVVGQTPVVGAFTVAFTPNVQIIREGVVLTVSAVVSADRRYVRLSLVPNFTSVTDIFTFTFSGAAGASGQTGGGTTTGFQGNGGSIGGGAGGTTSGSISGGQTSGGQTTSGQTTTGQTTQGGNTGVTSSGNVVNAPITQTVQQPVQEIISIQTAVSVPDGGTVLLGGIKRLKEGRNMAGVPILNKIPYISRLFKNSGVGRETDSLMMMVTPRIIIQEEEEELLGVPL